MKAPFIFRFFKIAVSCLFYLLIIVSVFYIVTGILNIAGQKSAMQLKLKEVELLASDKVAVPDSLKITAGNMQLIPQMNKYDLAVAPASGAGIYLFAQKLVFILLGLLILWNFKKIFETPFGENPFNYSVLKRLYNLALIFIGSDFLNLIHYFIFNSVVNARFPAQHIWLIGNAGNDLITGLLILAIGSIYKRGLDIQTENALTV